MFNGMIRCRVQLVRPRQSLQCIHWMTPHPRWWSCLFRNNNPGKKSAHFWPSLDLREKSFTDDSSAQKYLSSEYDQHPATNETDRLLRETTKLLSSTSLSSSLPIANHTLVSHWPDSAMPFLIGLHRRPTMPPCHRWTAPLTYRIIWMIRRNSNNKHLRQTRSLRLFIPIQSMCQGHPHHTQLNTHHRYLTVSIRSLPIAFNRVYPAQTMLRPKRHLHLYRTRRPETIRKIFSQRARRWTSFLRRAIPREYPQQTSAWSPVATNSYKTVPAPSMTQLGAYPPQAPYPLQAQQQYVLGNYPYATPTVLNSFGRIARVHLSFLVVPNNRTRMVHRRISIGDRSLRRLSK